jgi:hypothetical protein
MADFLSGYGSTAIFVPLIEDSVNVGSGSILASQCITDVLNSNGVDQSLKRDFFIHNFFDFLIVIGLDNRSFLKLIIALGRSLRDHSRGRDIIAREDSVGPFLGLQRVVLAAQVD